MATKRRTKAAATPPDADMAPAAAPATVAPAPVAPADTAVRLPGNLQIRNAEEVANLLRAALATRELRLDAAAVSQVDTAGVQLLVAAIASAKRDGAKPQWLAASPTLRDAARRLGVEALLEMPAAASA